MKIADLEIAGSAPLQPKQEGSFPQPINLVQSFNHVADKDEGIDDDDVSLSLYVGAINDEHQPDLEEEVKLDGPCYKNFSKVPFAEAAVAVSEPKNHLTFPVILHRILSSGCHRNSIQWLFHGRAFAIVDEAKFFGEVTPNYFCTYEKGKFMQWIEAYGFQQVQYHVGRVMVAAFYHEKFLRYRHWLAYTMRPGVGRDIPNRPQVAEVLQHFDRIPALQEVMIPYSSLWTMPVNYPHRIPASGQVAPVAHPFLPQIFLPQSFPATHAPVPQSPTCVSHDIMQGHFRSLP